jgi:hypothetical protein
MKNFCQTTMTPSKLINPFYASIRPKYYKPLKTYLEMTRIRPGRKQDLIEEVNASDRKIGIVDIPEFNSFSLKNKKKRNSSQINKSCKIKASIESPNVQRLKKFEIPLIEYKSFEPFHLPNVKGKLKIREENNRIRLISQRPREETSESLPPATVRVPKRVEIAQHSKEFFEKLIRVKDIVKNIEHEFLDDVLDKSL